MCFLCFVLFCFSFQLLPRSILGGQAQDLKLTCELNRAACDLKLQRYKEAKVACQVVLQSQPENIKALFRRAQARRFEIKWGFSCLFVSCLFVCLFVCLLVCLLVLSWFVCWLCHGLLSFVLFWLSCFVLFCFVLCVSFVLVCLFDCFIDLMCFCFFCCLFCLFACFVCLLVLIGFVVLFCFVLCVCFLCV